jgi:hypothetical protein
MANTTMEHRRSKRELQAGGREGRAPDAGMAGS